MQKTGGEEKMKRTENIPAKMKAVMCCGPNDYRLMEVDTPQIDEDGILCQVEACGICAGDVKSWRGAAMFWGDGDVLPVWNDAPCVGGHEFIGRVVAIGDRAAEKWRLEIGDRAIAEQIVPCGHCRYCRDGHYWMCEEAHIHGHQKEVADGGMAQYIRFGANDIVHKVNKDIPAREAAMIEPLSCAIHTIERADIGFNDVVVIAGMGPIGLCKLQLAKLKNPRMLIAIDGKKMRLDLAKELGAVFGKKTIRREKGQWESCGRNHQFYQLYGSRSCVAADSSADNARGGCVRWSYKQACHYENLTKIRSKTISAAFLG